MRTFEILVSAIALIVASPFLLLAALLIRLEDHGPVFFRQIRIGKNGQPFTMYKLRSMRVQSPEPQPQPQQPQHQQPQHASQSKLTSPPQLTVGHDYRITRTGHWLRRLKLDEWPQFWNVIRGDMSLVGPRPEVEKYVRLYTSEQRRVLELRPGITDLASLKYYNESETLAQVQDPEKYYVDTIMPDKIRINLDYAARRTFASDIKVLADTIKRGLHVS